MTDICLESGQNGYDEVGKHILDFWRGYSFCTTIVRIRKSYDGTNWDTSNEIVYPVEWNSDMEWLNDWWEGQQFIRILGIKAVDDLVIEPYEAWINVATAAPEEDGLYEVIFVNHIMANPALNDNPYENVGKPYLGMAKFKEGVWKSIQFSFEQPVAYNPAPLLTLKDYEGKK